jgi:hypothetical protein
MMADPSVNAALRDKRAAASSQEYMADRAEHLEDRHDRRLDPDQQGSRRCRRTRPLARPDRRAARRRHCRRRLRPGPGYDAVVEHSPEAAVVVPPRSTAVLSPSAETDPTQRDRHIQAIAEQGRMGWQRTSGYNARAGAEGAMSRYKRIIGDTLRSHTRPAQEVETRITVTVLNRMLDRPESVRAA